MGRTQWERLARKADRIFVAMLFRAAASWTCPAYVSPRGYAPPLQFFFVDIPPLLAAVANRADPFTEAVQNTPIVVSAALCSLCPAAGARCCGLKRIFNSFFLNRSC